MQDKVRISDVINYLEIKIIENDYTDEEYGLYIDLRKNIKSAINNKLHRPIINQLKKAVRSFKAGE